MHLPAQCAQCGEVMMPTGNLRTSMRFVVEGPLMGYTVRGADYVETIRETYPRSFVTEINLGLIKAHVECMKCGHRHEVPPGLVSVDWDARR